MDINFQWAFEWAILCCILAVIIPGAYLLVTESLTPAPPDLPSQGCGIIFDRSDSISETHTSMLFLGKIWMPQTVTTTKYHTFMVCVNGTREDRGYL